MYFYAASVTPPQNLPFDLRLTNELLAPPNAGCHCDCPWIWTFGQTSLNCPVVETFHSSRPVPSDLASHSGHLFLPFLQKCPSNGKTSRNSSRSPWSCEADLPCGKSSAFPNRAQQQSVLRDFWSLVHWLRFFSVVPSQSSVQKQPMQNIF